MSLTKKTTHEADSATKQVLPQASMTAESHKKAHNHTKIVIKCNCGFPNNLFIRGEGIPGVNWEKGTLLKCIKEDEWVWESDTPFKSAKFKILLNDKQYEVGDNHCIDCGKSITFTPNF